MDWVGSLSDEGVRQRDIKSDAAAGCADIEHVVVELAGIVGGQFVARHVVRVMGEDQPEAGLIGTARCGEGAKAGIGDRKSTRLNSSHSQISYAVFCLKKKIKD